MIFQNKAIKVIRKDEEEDVEKEDDDELEKDEKK